jgi:DNA ligase D-like protein (predicted polymerase)|nr:ATP-dependent DNA ligase [Kofleriaceae bacterium]
MAKAAKVALQVAGREVVVSNPDKLYFRAAQITKRQLVDYYLAVADGALRGVARRPQIMKRYVDGADGEPFFQKRVPASRPPWIEIATFRFPSGRSADEVVVNDAAQLAWLVNLGCIDLNPHAVRADDMERPDELRIDLDPVPGVAWPQIRDVAAVVRDALADFGLAGWVKTSGSRGAHIWVRIVREHEFAAVRRAAQAFAREIARRAPAIATAKWWKEERHGVFVDYNQNARDRTTCSAYSVRATQDARVSMPLAWDDFLRCDPADYTLATVPALIAARGDAHADIDARPGRLDGLLELARAQEAAGARDGPEPRSKPRVLVIAQAKLKVDALAGLERWKARHADVVAMLQPADVLVDANRGRSSAWYRVRVNLARVPAAMQPPDAPPDPDYDVRGEWLGAGGQLDGDG